MWVAACCSLLATQMLWLTFAPIDTDVARDFGVSKNAIGWLAQVFPLLYVVLALSAGLALDRWFRGTLAGGAALATSAGPGPKDAPQLPEAGAMPKR